MTTGVYKITNLVNGKVYIGASKNIERRWGNHRGSVKSPIHSDLEAYGIENFKFEVLLECPEDMLCQWERDMIALYDADDPEKGYNNPKDRPYSLKNSESHRGRSLSKETRCKVSEALRGHTVSKETRCKVSESNRGKHSTPHSEDAKRKISEALKGRPSPRKGRPGTPHSDEAKRKISEAHRGKSHSDEAKRKMSEAHKGKPSGMKGQVAWNRGLKMKPVSEETKRKLSEAKRLYLQKKKENICS